MSFSSARTSTRTSTTSTLCNPSSASSKSTSSTLCNASTSSTSTSIFPQTFGIYRPRSSSPHLVLAHSSKSTSNLLFYISIHSSFRSKPDIILHHGPTKAHPSLASAQSKEFTAIPQITLGSTRDGAAPTEPLHTEGLFHTIHYFSLFLHGLGVRERFEWKNSCGAEVKTLGDSSGMKLIRVKTGQVVTVYADVSFAVQKRGKMSFLETGKEQDLGDEWRIMVVMTLMVILEARRSEENTAAACAAAGAGVAAVVACC